MDALEVRRVNGGTVFPTIRVPSHPGKLLMGVFDDDGDLVPGTVLNRRAGEQGAPVPPGLLPAPVAAEEPEAIYAGPLYFHFGHFLLESLARAWYARQRPDLPLVWAGAHTWQKASLKGWQIEILEVLGINRQSRMIADPTRFQTLHVPDIGYRYDDWFHPEHAAFLGRYDGIDQQTGSRLWLSRNKLDNEWRDLNAAPTERRLAANGWTVINPEQLTIREQLDHLSRAEVVAGEEGSSFHMIVLLRDVATKRLEILRRHGPEHRNMHTVGDARQVTQQFHTLGSERVLEAKGRYVTKINPNSSEILDLLQVPVPVAPHGGSDGAEERALAGLAPARVLTVGHTGLPDGVRTAPAAVAVSTRFDVDPRSYADDPARFFELDLAQYAEHFHDADETFDVIWIQAADFDEFMRSFELSTGMAAERAVWIFGTGPLAARSALAVGLTQPGYAVEQRVDHGTTLFLVNREPGALTGAADIARLSDKQVARRLRPAEAPWLRRLRRVVPTRLRRAVPVRLRRAATRRLRELSRR